MGIWKCSVENLVSLNLFNGVYQDRKVLLTGHTGFKGSWLALWLMEMGAKVTGLGLDPDTIPSHWNLLQIKIDDRRVDIRCPDLLKNTISEVRPDIVFHLAAQPLVRRSYEDPLTTWSTNVIGTANLLEACRHCPSVKAIVVITSDKCYENLETDHAFIEGDRLGGYDPYSASKAAAELLVESFRKSFFSEPGCPLIATARAGNVIGGGDWGEDRLIPDLIRASIASKSLEVRSPRATRPWQHVLESLSGYLMLAQHLFEQGSVFATSWNFGPDVSENIRVEQILDLMKDELETVKWHINYNPQPHEANRLHLNINKARHKLDWLPIWNLPKGVKKTALWYHHFLKEGSVISKDQLSEYINDAHIKQVAWAS